MTYICKNICSKKEGVGKKFTGHELPDNWRFPFLSHGRCRTCQAWQRLYLRPNRCVCCHSLLSLRPRLNQNRRRYLAT